MVNRPKAKGTALETALVRWARDNGFPGADRLTLTGAADRGDVALCPGVVVECKNYAAALDGNPPLGLVAKWLGEAERERVNARADYAFVVCKRRGTTDVGTYWAWMALGDVLRLCEAPGVSIYPSDPVRLSVRALGALFRASWYGTPISLGGEYQWHA